MSWQAASLALLALALACGFALVRARAAARAGDRGRGGARGARGRRAARVRRVPERQAHHRHRPVRRLRARRRAGVRGRRGHRDRLEHLPLAGPLDRLADGRMGRGRHRGRRARAHASRPRAEPVRARRGVRPGRPRVRRVDGRVSMDTRRPTGSRYLCGCGRDLSAVQHRPRRGQRRVLPPDRAGLPARARALPPPPRGALGALARAGGARRHRGRASCCCCPAAAVAATPAQRAASYLAKAQNKDGGFGATPGAGLQPAVHRLGRPRARLGRPQPAGREAAEGPLAGALRAPPGAARSPTSARSSARRCSHTWPASARAASAGAT